uniref:Uncharacterized protein n=1 Tax=Triticum urartu TaxID=4572 RepID=A0A8R7UXX2_TRIUA
MCAVLVLHDEAAERRPVRDALAALVAGAVAAGGGRRGRRREALHHAALVAAAAACARARVLRVRPRILDRRSLLLLAAVLLPRPVAAGRAYNLWGRRRRAGYQLAMRQAMAEAWIVRRTYAYFASEGAEAEGVEEAALADLAGVGDPLARPRLRALVEEHHARAVDDVRLHAGDVQHPLYLRRPDHVVVRRPPNLLPCHASVKTNMNRSNRGGRGYRRTPALENGLLTDLDGVVVAVVGEAERAERAVDAVEAVHVALALVRVGVRPALHEEARRQQRLQPRRPPLVLRLLVLAPRSSLLAQHCSFNPAPPLGSVENQETLLEIIIKKSIS